MHKHLSFIRFISSLCIGQCLIIIGDCQQSQLQSDIRFTKVSICNTTGLKLNLQNFSTSYIYPRSYLSFVVNVTDEMKKLKGSIMQIDRCNDQDFMCEDFQTWRLDDFCPMLTWKDQMWSAWVEGLHPPFRCPIKKGIYEARNISLNTNTLMGWYPDSVKYHWRFNAKLWNEQNKLVMCSDFHWHIYQFRIKNKKHTNA